MSICTIQSIDGRNIKFGGSQFEVNLNTTVVKATGMSIIEMVIPYTFYRIHEGYPDRGPDIRPQLFWKKQNNITYDCALAPGTYDGNQLATEITTKMSAVVADTQTYTCTYDDVSNAFTITGSLPADKFGFQCLDLDSTADKHVAQTLGLELKNYDNLTVNTITPINAPELYPSVIHASIFNLSFDSQNSSNTNDNLIVIPVNAKYKENIIYQTDETDVIAFAYSQDIQSLHFRFSTQDGHILGGPVTGCRNSSIMMRIKFYF